LIGKPQLYNTDSQIPDKIGIGNNESLQIIVRMILYPQTTLTQWSFAGRNGESEVIQNNTDGYSIVERRSENKQNSSLYKHRLDTKDFGEYTIVVANDVGNFTRIYHVDAKSEFILMYYIECQVLYIKATVFTYISVIRIPYK
jgi:hypothetical protein